ncbi:hypothetical protein C2G38_2087347 [Gigaspora rosea]|uniref:Uncharacterized protein n=1 Tax=Gigaspora rosea TaxID=44941 RepID=A0A397VA62_9GLOM|nr:hypothetical protein C2G38_2087347 [Gigaspora rosea]
MIDDYLNILDTWIAESKTETKKRIILKTPEQHSKDMDDCLNEQIKPKEFCDQNGKSLDEAIENWNRKRKIMNPCPIESIEPQSVEIDHALDSNYQNEISPKEKEHKALPYYQKSDEVDKLSDNEIFGWYSTQDTANAESPKLESLHHHVLFPIPSF